MNDMNNLSLCILQVLSGIKILKLYAWEASFEAKINKIRSKEMKTLKGIAYIYSGFSFTWTLAPFLVRIFVKLSSICQCLLKITFWNVFRQFMGFDNQLFFSLIICKDYFPSWSRPEYFTLFSCK